MASGTVFFRLRSSRFYSAERESVMRNEESREQKEFYPDANTVLDGIIPSYLTGFIYSSLVDSYCSEQEARMTAMNSAGKKCGRDSKTAANAI